MLIRIEKVMNRHERDLVKLKPITLQAPEASNTESDVISCLSDIMAAKLKTLYQHVFVSRNEFQVLEKMLPNQTAHFVKEIAAIERKVDQKDHLFEVLDHKIEKSSIQTTIFFR